MVTSKVEIKGQEYNFLNIALKQYLAKHHRFEVSIPAHELGNKDKVATLSDVKKLIGEDIKITIEHEGNQLFFSGLITSINISRAVGQAHDVIFSGYSPTILIEDGKHCRSFEKKKPSDIVKAILGDFNKLKTPEINPRHDSEQEYFTQYKETNYNFIARLANLFGEWFYYDGQTLHYGEYKKGNEFNLKLGEATGEYDISFSLLPANFTFSAYDYSKNEVLKSNSSDVNIKGLDEFGELALNRSKQFFPNNTILPIVQYTDNQQQLDSWMEYYKSSYATNMVKLSGDSNNPGIHLGTTIKLVENDNTVIGKYVVTNVIHSANKQGRYRNHFEAVPISIKIPPRNRMAMPPVAETQVAVVKDNVDPDGLGRVRVQFHWQEQNDMSPWIRVVYPHGGSGDIYFAPEVDDEVMVGFEFDNPNRPYVMGSVYHGKNKPTYFAEDNSIKAIRTKDGNRIILIDGEEGEIQILNKEEKNSITLSLKDGGAITLKTEGNVYLIAKNIEATAEETFSVEAKSIEMKAEEFTVDMQKTVNMKSGQDTTIEGQNVDVSAQQAASMKGMEAKVEGQTSAEVKGTQTKVEGSATTTIKGGLVKIN